MKNLLISLCLLVFSISSIKAQDTTQFNTVMSTNPILTSIGWLNTNIEHKLNRKSSIVAMVDIVITDFYSDLFRVGLGMGYRRYITHKVKPSPRGFYIQPQIRTFLGGDHFVIVPGFELGYQWVWKSGFSLNLGIGPALYLSDGDAVSAPTGTLAVGYAW